MRDWVPLSFVIGAIAFIIFGPHLSSVSFERQALTACLDTFLPLEFDGFLAYHVLALSKYTLLVLPNEFETQCSKYREIDNQMKSRYAATGYTRTVSGVFWEGFLKCLLHRQDLEPDWSKFELYDDCRKYVDFYRTHSLKEGIGFDDEFYQRVRN